MEEHNPNYYGYYFKGILGDLCRQLRISPSQSNKMQLHEELKEYIGEKTISGMNDMQLRIWIKRVLLVCAREKGIYIRHRKDQPIDVEWGSLSDLWDMLD